jgi:hypothetical protein
MTMKKYGPKRSYDLARDDDSTQWYPESPREGDLHVDAWGQRYRFRGGLWVVDVERELTDDDWQRT